MSMNHSSKTENTNDWDHLIHVVAVNTPSMHAPAMLLVEDELSDMQICLIMMASILSVLLLLLIPACLCSSKRETALSSSKRCTSVHVEEDRDEIYDHDGLYRTSLLDGIKVYNPDDIAKGDEPRPSLHVFRDKTPEREPVSDRADAATQTPFWMLDGEDLTQTSDIDKHAGKKTVNSKKSLTPNIKNKTSLRGKPEKSRLSSRPEKTAGKRDESTLRNKKTQPTESVKPNKAGAGKRDESTLRNRKTQPTESPKQNKPNVGKREESTLRNKKTQPTESPKQNKAAPVSANRPSNLAKVEPLKEMPTQLSREKSREPILENTQKE